MAPRRKPIASGFSAPDFIKDQVEELVIEVEEKTVFVAEQEPEPEPELNVSEVIQPPVVTAPAPIAPVPTPVPPKPYKPEPKLARHHRNIPRFSAK
jgi:hypothetical protein